MRATWPMIACLSFLIVTLAYTAISKLVWLAEGGFVLSEPQAPYAVAALLELGCVALLLPQRTRQTAALIVACGFAGAASSDAVWSMLYGAPRACHCLGAIEVPQSFATILQGLVIALSGVVIWSRRSIGP